MITAGRTLGELARNIPGASQIFHEQGLRFCCGGDQALDAQSLVKQLEALAA
jgi:Regulator of cell morphogenesis and NO signaling